MTQEFFSKRPDVTPTIYAYELIGVESHAGYIKIGYTDRTAEVRIREQLHVSGVPYRILLKESAMRSDGTCFTDRDVHAFNMLILLAQVGVTPGENVLLVGNDDKQQSRYSLPRLSTIHQPTMEEGMLAVRKLIRMIFGGKEKTELIKPYLIVRESSGGGPEEEIISEYHD